MTDINFEQLAKNVGKAIGRQRNQAGFTQEQVAEHLNIGMEAVSRMERGLWCRPWCGWQSSLNCLVVSWRTFCVRPVTGPLNRALC